MSTSASSFGTYMLVSRGSFRFQKSSGLPALRLRFTARRTLPSPELYEAMALSQSPSLSS